VSRLWAGAWPLEPGECSHVGRRSPCCERAVSGLLASGGWRALSRLAMAYGLWC
jgi:hypothetical protein